MARTRTARGSGGSPQSGRSAGPSVLAFRNRSMSVLRGTAVSEFGDVSDVGRVLYTGIPASLAETSDVSYDAATQRQQVIRSVTCVMPAWADVEDSDTLMDEFTGWFYFVLSIESRPSIGYYPPDKILKLKMRSGVTIASD